MNNQKKTSSQTKSTTNNEPKTKVQTTKKPAAKKAVKPKKDYKKLLAAANDKIASLESSMLMQKLENEKNIHDFQAKAKTFQSKAQEEINKIKANLAKKLEQDQEHVKKYGSQKVLEAIFEPLANIEIAIKAGKNNEAVSAYVTGFEMLLNQLYQEISSLGITRIEPKVDEEFNPELHYAIHANAKSTHAKITKVVKIGLKLHDRVIKPATVEIN